MPMDFESAVAAHQKWKIRLRMAITGGNPENLSPQTVGVDNQCELGKWIHSEGKQRFGSKPEFLDMIKAHAEFHVVAGEVLKKSIAGDKDGASKLLDGDFFAKSSATVTAITKCKKACG